jgi:hypothetical protein
MTESLVLASKVVPAKWTERAVLDVMHKRFCPPLNGHSPRYAMAEHVRMDPGAGANGQILDAVTVDTWRSNGWALDGFEVKVSRSDLRRECNNVGKSQAWDGILNSFSIVAPYAVLHDWRTFGMPDTWGVLALVDGERRPTHLRWLRQPPTTTAYGKGAAVDRRIVASIARSTAKTGRLHCSRLGCGVS